MATFLILGAGMMGSALAVPIADRGHEVRLVGSPLDEEIVEAVRATGVHPRLGLQLPSTIRALSHRELDGAAQNVDAVAFGVSSAGIEWAARAIAPHMRSDLPLFMITKGLIFEDGRLVCLPDAVAARMPAAIRSSVHPAAIAGPCIAGEIARKVPTCVVLAGRDAGVLEVIREQITTPYYRPVPTTDLVGAEVCAALKNAYAMGIAFATGMHERAGGTLGSIAMHNLESAVMAQAVLEMQQIVVRLGGKASTASGLAGVGDLDVTTNGGRTGRFGKWLGMGLDRAQAIEKMQGATLECLEILTVMRTALDAGAIPGRSLQSFPLLEHMIHVALDDRPVEVPIAQFFQPDLTADLAS